MGQIKILIVEDEGIIARDLERLVKKLGYSVTAIAATGQDALKSVEEQRPDLVLMDIVLFGDVDGIEAAERIRSRVDIPVIYITAYADDKIMERAKVTEPYGYIIKPFEERELHVAVEMALYKHGMERRLRESEEWLSITLRSIGDGVIATDRDGTVMFMNPVAEALTGWPLHEAKGRKTEDVFHIINAQTRKPSENPVQEILKKGVASGFSDDTVLISRDSTERAVADSGAPIRDRDNALVGVVLVFRDVTERRKMDIALWESEQKLRIHAKELEETNTALKVLLKQRENDKREMEENILSNVKQLIFPYIEKLKRRLANSEDVAYLNIMESNLKEIISPFSYQLSSRYIGFTPREIMVADLIKDGKQDKDIMEMLNISYETVKSHRQNIRKKLNIYGKRTNLRTYLLSLGGNNGGSEQD